MAVNPLDLSDRCILVTGASSGIGLETARLLSELGATLILAGRKAETLEKAHLSLVNPSQHHVSVFDLADLDAIPGWIKALAADKGPLGGIVHSAGMQITMGLRSTTATAIDS